MNKQIVISALLGLASFAVLFFSTVSGFERNANANTAVVIFLMILSVVPLFVSGLGWGGVGSLISIATVSVANLVILDPLFSLVYFVVCGMPVLFLTRQALLWRDENNQISWYPASNLMGCWVIVGITLSCIAIIVLYMADTIRSELIANFDFAFGELEKQGLIKARLNSEKLIWFIPQFFGLFWAMVILAAGSIAQGILVQLKKNLRPTPEFSGFALPGWASVVFGAAFAIGVIGDIAGPVLGAITLILGAAFFLQGMAVLHRISMNWTFRGPLLAAVYLILILIWPAVIVLIIGLADSWVGFRGRQLVSPNQEED